jgi:hypothetical protein
MAHTPGNWVAQAYHVTAMDTGDTITPMGGAEVKVDCCIVPRVEGRTDAEALANARLIAASPALLAACEHVREALSVRADYWQNDPDQYGYLLDALDSVVAAISQASPPRARPTYRVADLKG